MVISECDIDLGFGLVLVTTIIAAFLPFIVQDFIWAIFLEITLIGVSVFLLQVIFDVGGDGCDH